MFRKWLYAGSLAAALWAASLSTAVAQDSEDEPEATDVGDLVVLEWLRGEERDWETGITLGVLGGVAAMVTAFTFAGMALPGSKLSAILDEQQAELDVLTDRLAELAATNPLPADQVTALNEVIDRLRDDLSRDRRWTYVVSAPLYVLLGAASAAIFAADIVQALVVGFGGPATLASWAAGKDDEARRKSKDAALDAARDELKRLAVSSTPRPTVENRIRVARAL